MKIVDIITGEKYEVLKYLKLSDGEEWVWCKYWRGPHIIGKDCAFEADAKCNCTPDQTTGWITIKACNICGKEVK